MESCALLIKNVEVGKLELFRSLDLAASIPWSAKLSFEKYSLLFSGMSWESTVMWRMQ
jgi:hypothetical protein